MRTHLMIPDLQMKPGVPKDHLYWLGQFIADTLPDVIINIGDWYDMPSLSYWDKGKRVFEGRRYKEDIKSGHEALEIVEGPLNAINLMRKRNRKGLYRPEKHYMLGNHEYRADKVANDSAEFEGVIGTETITKYWEDRDWNVHPFMRAVPVDGVWYCHYMANPFTSKPWGGQIDNRLKQVGNSFSMGHQQTFMYGQRVVGRNIHHGLVAGSFYLHDEEYKGPDGRSVVSGNNHWRGIILKHEVENGNYDLEKISMDRLCRRYEGVGIAEYLTEHYPESRLTLAA